MCVTAALDQPSHLQPSNMCLGHFGLDGLLGMCALRRSMHIMHNMHRTC